MDIRVQFLSAWLMRAFTLILLLNSYYLDAQNEVNAPWISYPSASVTDYGVFHFRKNFTVDLVPDTLLVNISADNRYHLYVNGTLVCYGPAKGDLKTYKYDIIDIAPYLVEGANLLAATVYNAGRDKPMSLQSNQTAFFLSTSNESFKKIESNESWKVLKNEAYKPISYYEMLFKERWFYGYYACGPGDDVDGDKYPWGWNQIGFDDSAWKQAEVLSFNGKSPWDLVPRNIAFMDRHMERPLRIRKSTGIPVSQDFLKGEHPIFIPAHKNVVLLLDYEVLTMGYPELMVSGGQGSSIKVKYAEALYEKVNLKAHRDSIDEKIMYGVWDIFRPDGGEQRLFRPLWKRTMRYVQLEIETQNEPLHILSYENEYSGYPYNEMSTFVSDDSNLNQIFKMGQRTLKMCSGETYYDTPFYEQLSYGGDNRPITSLSIYNSTDDRLLREVLRLYPQSVNKETGLFKSAYPSRFDFDMAGWSLAWIQSLHDYYFLRGDRAFIEQFVPDIEGVLGYFHRHMDEGIGILGPMKTDVFMDWSITKGNIPRKNKGDEIVHSTMFSLYYAHTLDCVVKLYEKWDMKSVAQKWKQEANLIRKSVLENSYDKETKLFTDYPNQKIFSQHTNILAILCDVIPLSDQKKLLIRILNGSNFEEIASSYFSYFLFMAMKKTGQEHLFLSNLKYWYGFINTGHTTVGETGFASHDRSDCHAWSAHPSYYFLSLVCGINPGDIGFNKVIITPSLGELGSVKASMPHPKGRIAVTYNLKNGRFNANIHLPIGLNGVFEYQGHKFLLKEGDNEIDF